jgi:hypothetical protein
MPKERLQAYLSAGHRRDRSRWVRRRAIRPRPREPRARRWLLALRAFDAVASGASQREIAEELFVALYRSARWKTDSEFLRLRVNRLLRLARRMMSEDYRLLLR